MWRYYSLIVIACPKIFNALNYCNRNTLEDKVFHYNEWFMVLIYFIMTMCKLNCSFNLFVIFNAC